MRVIQFEIVTAVVLTSVGVVTGEAAWAQTIDDVVSWLEPLVLEETPEALNARPRLSVDPAGGYIVSDRQVNQIRLYREDGSLRAFFGRTGDGPGEFRDLRAAARLRSDLIAAVDYDGRLSLWSEGGDLLDDHRLDMRGVISAVASRDGRVTLGTVPSPSSFENLQASVFYEVEVESGEVVADYFAFPLDRENAMAALSVVGTFAPPASPIQAVTWTVFDSLWVIDTPSRSVVGRIELESELLKANAPPVDRRRDPERFSAWMRATSFPVEAFEAPGGGWLVTLRRTGNQGVEWGLLKVDAAGRMVWEIPRGPRLVATDLSTGVLYFADPESLEPNRFERARLRNSVGP